jgi:predicted phosphodiesterase
VTPRLRRWALVVALALVSAVLLGDVALRGLQDKRIRLQTLVTLDPPAAPIVLRVGGHTLAITGALVRVPTADPVVLRAWAPTPSIQVVQAVGPGVVTLAVENIPARVHLEGDGPVQETRRGLTRTVSFAPATTRHVGFADLAHDVTFALLGDTGDDPTFPEALRLAALMDAEFLIHLGDLIYGDEQMPGIRRIMDASPIPIYMVRGNHDYRNQARIDFMRTLGPPYYVFRIGGATFVVLDNAGNYLPTFWRRSTQYHWLTGVLGVPRDGPLFVVAHKPPFDRRTGEKRAYLDDEPFAAQLMRDFVRAGVAAMFTGHVHGTHYWVQDGIPYVINGEGFESPTGPKRHQMGWVRVRGREVVIHQVPIWGAGPAR